MDDRTRDDLLVKLSAARARAAEALQQLQGHAAQMERVRASLGNPYFYSGRPADDLESEARFSGYASHEPARRLYVELQNVTREVQRLRDELRDGGVDT